ncbi:hypothetical protein KL938_002330 [Ogataea parapolymorpha]|nr:hypothetical protein KL938_002330 [Ogataea parapolymorpha]
MQHLPLGFSGVPQGVRVSVNIGGLVTEGQITPKVVCLDGTILCHPAGHRHRGGFLRKQRDGLGSGDGREDVARGFTRSWILAGGTEGQGRLTRGEHFGITGCSVRWKQRHKAMG